MRARTLLVLVPILATAAGCSSASSPAASAPPAATTAPAPSAAAESQLADAPTTADPGQAFAAWMAAHGFTQKGVPDYVVDSTGEAVCGNLQSQSMSAEIAYEESVDKNSLTGMTTNKDILAMIGEAVATYCPQYAKNLPTS